MIALEDISNKHLKKVAYLINLYSIRKPRTKLSVLLLQLLGDCCLRRFYLHEDFFPY